MRLSIFLLIGLILGVMASAASAQTKHVIFTFVDHFEPADQSEVDLWVDSLTPMAAPRVDSDGVHFQHSWFMLSPANWFDIWGVGAPDFDPLHGYARKLNEATYAGVGEVDYHLHHGVTDERTRTEAVAIAEVIDWTAQSTARMTQHGAWITAEATPRIAYGFVHGMWALDNTRDPNGYNQWCGVNEELPLLSSLGVYADFTFPAWGPMEPLRNDVIMYAQDDTSSGSYKNPANLQDVTVGLPPFGDLMIIQGPKTNTNIGGGVDAPATLARMDEWVGHNIRVVGNDDWIFVKVYTHGCVNISSSQTARDYYWGPPMAQFLDDIETAYRDDPNWSLHYASAREMYNIVKAAEAGMTGNPNNYRDFEIPPYANTLILTTNAYNLVTYADGVAEFDMLDANDTSIEFAMKEFDPATSLVQEWDDGQSQWFPSNAARSTGSYGELVFTDDTPSVAYRVSVAPPTPTGDLNGDGIVDITDLNMVLIDWSKSAPNLSDPRSDGNQDGTVDIVDLNIVLIDWGKSFHDLTVISGSGSGTYSAGHVVAITADAVAGSQFAQWTGDVGGVGDVNSAITDITMPAADASVTATYSLISYSLTVLSGTGSGSYTHNHVVAISAESPPTDMIFVQWAGDTSGIDNAASADANMIMPPNDATVTATYAAPAYAATFGHGQAGAYGPDKIDFVSLQFGSWGVRYGEVNPTSEDVRMGNLTFDAALDYANGGFAGLIGFADLFTLAPPTSGANVIVIDSAILELQFEAYPIAGETLTASRMLTNWLTGPAGTNQTNVYHDALPSGSQWVTNPDGTTSYSATPTMQVSFGTSDFTTANQASVAITEANNNWGSKLYLDVAGILQDSYDSGVNAGFLLEYTGAAMKQLQDAGSEGGNWRETVTGSLIGGPTLSIEYHYDSP